MPRRSTGASEAARAGDLQDCLGQREEAGERDEDAQKGLREEQRGGRGREEHRPDGERRDLGALVQEVGDG